MTVANNFPPVPAALSEAESHARQQAFVDAGAELSVGDSGACPLPLTALEFNTNGTRDPLFYGVERFETRSLFAHLLRLELAGDAEAALVTYRIAKAQSVRTWLRKLAELTRLGASPQVMAWQTGLVRRWQRALDSQAALQDLYLVEGYRSHLLDVQDDLSGKSCTPMTLRRIDAVEQTLRERFSLLQDHDGLFFGDENRDQQQLLAMIAERRQRARRYLL